MLVPSFIEYPMDAGLDPLAVVTSRCHKIFHGLAATSFFHQLAKF